MVRVLSLHRRNQCCLYLIDYDGLKTLDMKLVAGREYSEEFPTDRRKSIIVNEALVKKS